MDGGCASVQNKPHKLVVLIQIKAQIQDFLNVAFKIPFSGDNVFYLIPESALLNKCRPLGFVIGMRSTEQYCSYDTFMVFVFVNVKLRNLKQYQLCIKSDFTDRMTLNDKSHKHP